MHLNDIFINTYIIPFFPVRPPKPSLDSYFTPQKHVNKKVFLFAVKVTQYQR